jgi:purine-binding chemotaxis protein CheW
MPMSFVLAATRLVTISSTAVSRIEHNPMGIGHHISLQLIPNLKNLPICLNMSDAFERTQNLLVFHLSGLNCAFPLEAVREIVPMASLSSPPGLPSGLAGFLDLRGTAIPIVRLDRLFDLPEQHPGLHTPMIILRGVLGPIGILADRVRGIEPMPSARLVDIPEDTTFQGCATASVELDGEQIHLLSPTALLSANENRLLADHGAMAQARLLHLPEKNLDAHQVGGRFLVHNRYRKIIPARVRYFTVPGGRGLDMIR